MQFFFCGLLVAAITYFLKLGHNNHGLIFTVVTLGLLRAVETVGLLWAVETIGLLRAVETMGSTCRRHNGPSTGRIINGPCTSRMIGWPNMGQTDRIMAVNGLDLESSIHGPTITGHR